MKVAVVILNWNGKKFLEKFLPSVIRYNSADAEIIIADNNSSDDSVAFMQEVYPRIRVIRNDSNGGFAKGYNDALKQVDAKYYVLLNSDVEVTENWIDPVISMLDGDPLIAAAQPKILAFSNRCLFEYAGAAGGYIDKYGFPFCRGRIFDTQESDNGQYNNACEIFWATGACLFVRSDRFHEAGGFDEDFFAHMEEIDLCWRLRNRGHKIMYCPGSAVYHVGAGTLQKSSPRKTYLNFRNNLFLILKNHTPRFLFAKLFVRMAMDGLAALRFLTKGEFAHFYAVLKAHYSFYMTLRPYIRKRKLLRKDLKEYTTTGVYRRSIVADYYLRGIRTFDKIDPSQLS